MCFAQSARRIALRAESRGQIAAGRGQRSKSREQLAESSKQ